MKKREQQKLTITITTDIADEEVKSLVKSGLYGHFKLKGWRLLDRLSITNNKNVFWAEEIMLRAKELGFVQSDRLDYYTITPDAEPEARHCAKID